MIGSYGHFGFHPGPWTAGGPAMMAQYGGRQSYGALGANPVDTVTLQTAAAAQVAFATGGVDVSAGFKPLDVFWQAPANDLGALYRRAYWLALTYRVLYGGGIDRRVYLREAKKALSDAGVLSAQPVIRQGDERAVSIMAQTAADMDSAVQVLMTQRPRADRVAQWRAIVASQATPTVVAARQQETASGGGATIPGPAGKVVQAATEAVPKGMNAAKEAVDAVGETVAGAKKKAETAATLTAVAAGVAIFGALYLVSRKR